MWGFIRYLPAGRQGSSFVIDSIFEFRHSSFILPSAVSHRNIHDYFDDEFLARLRGLHLIAKRLAASPAGNRGRSRALGDGLEFADHRAYSPGDDVRFIDWPYYARMEKLLLRLFHEHSESGVAILLDTSGSMAPGGEGRKFHHARRIAAVMAYVAMGSGRRVVLQQFGPEEGGSMRCGRDRTRIPAVLSFLTDLSPGGGTDLRQCARRFDARAHGVGVVLLISDLLDSDESLSDALSLLGRKRRQVVVFHVYSPDESDPPLGGAVRVRDAETGREISLHVTAQLRRSYRRRWRNFCDRVEKTSRLHGAIYVSAGSDLPFEKLILQTLRRSGVLS